MTKSSLSINKALLATDEHLPYIHRDISWLSFNYRVLQEAKNPSVPLLERLKFLAIYSSNLDEFFRVRVASHRRLMKADKGTKRELGISPKATVKEIQRIVNKQQEEVSKIFEKQLVPELRKQNIYILRRLELNEEQKHDVDEYFRNYLLPYAQPVLIVKGKIRLFLNNAALYLAVWMHEKGHENPTDQYAIVKIPSDHLPRFHELPPSAPGRHDLIMLDDIVRYNIEKMFPGYHIKDTFSIKLTRDAEMILDEEFSVDVVNKIRENLDKRHVGSPSRFVYDREMPPAMLNFLVEVINEEREQEDDEDDYKLDKYSLLREGRYHNNFDFFKFPDFGMTHLKNPPLPPLPYRPLEEAEDFFSAIAREDHLIYSPYHSYQSVIRFFEEAADNPKVTHIKLTHYRVARNSRIMQALMHAAKSGKQVSVVVEVKARFDEEANLNWGEKLQREGVAVHFIKDPVIKVHAKLALIRCNEGNVSRMYAYLATGNFNEDTARVYTDFGFFTANSDLVTEVARVFSFLESGSRPTQPFEHLLVGQFNLRSEFENLIRFEINEAKAGRPAAIVLKMNSIQDLPMIKLLYEASQAGVKIELIIRGICCLAPGVKGLSENIEAISIVDRFLEHARVFIFHHAGEDRIYLSSADWMVRNLSHRVETAFPIYSETLKSDIKDYMQIQLSDNVKARVLDENFSNAYYKNNSDIAIRSQLETYYYVKRRAGRK
ncbi:MAG: polyphosphate kinase 1 [Saprospiraceae bacterium]